MSHDRGCWKCWADSMGEKRECYARIGERCVKASLFRRGDPSPAKPIEGHDELRDPRG